MSKEGSIEGIFQASQVLRAEGTAGVPATEGSPGDTGPSLTVLRDSVHSRRMSSSLRESMPPVPRGLSCSNLTKRWPL